MNIVRERFRGDAGTGLNVSGPRVPGKLKEIHKEDIADGGGRSVFAPAASRFPVLTMDRNFTVLYANRACGKLFPGTSCFEKRFFFDISGRYLGVEGIKQVRDVVLNGRNGYSWRGTIDIKTRTHPVINALVFIFPSGRGNPPEEFIVFFDDFTKERKAQLHGIFRSLLDASKLKDNDTGEHINRVNCYSEVLARALYGNPRYPVVDAGYMEDIGFLAAMHDVGKIGTPDMILTKAGPLSEAEFATMREHTTNGAFILDAYPNAMAKEIALSHHERWDGGGYPYRWAGYMIPLHARIVSIADVYDALRMPRSYKPAYSHDEAMQKMKKGKGTQFDPGLFEIFVSVSEKFNRIYEENKDELSGAGNELHGAASEDD